MSSVVKKLFADRMAFKHQPKSFELGTPKVAQDFVALQEKKSSDFQIADIVANHSGVEAIRKQHLETQVEGTVLERLKEIEEQAYKQAHGLGLIEGTEKAFAETSALIAEKLAQLDQVIAELDRQKLDIMKENEAVLMKLVYQIAKRIAIREIETKQEPILNLLNELVVELQGAENVNIRLNPEDLDFIDQLRAKNAKEVEKIERVKLHANPAVKKGGCLVETNFGEIDATVEHRVDKAWSIIEAKLPQIKKDPVT